MPSAASFLPVIALLASFRGINAAQVHSLGQGGQCLQVSGTPSNGAAVTLGSCNGNNANSGTATGQQWIISPGNNAGVQLYGSNFCLDGQADEAGRETVVFPCIGNAAQTFYLTGDNRIAITGGTQCLTSAANGIENENCAPNVGAQAFSPTLLFDTDSVSSSAVGIGAPATSGASSAASSASSAASAATASASSVASAASASATGAASSAASQASSAASAASSGAQSATSSAASAASSGASSLASGASSGASAATSAVASGATSLASGATSVASAATSGIESLGSAVGSGVTSAAGAATSAVGGTGGAIGVKQIAAGFWVAVGVVVGAAVVA